MYVETADREGQIGAFIAKTMQLDMKQISSQLQLAPGWHDKDPADVLHTKTIGVAHYHGDE